MFNRSFKQNISVIPASGIVDASQSTGAVILPTGTTAQRPTPLSTGAMRWNTTNGNIDLYTGNATAGWQNPATYAAGYLIVAVEDVEDAVEGG
jgi:hypothetical protein